MTLSLRPGVGLNIASDMKVPSVDTVLKARCRSEYCIRHDGSFC